MSKWKNKFNWEKIKQDIEKQRNQKKSYKDERFWSPDWRKLVEQDDFVTLRFLPDKEGVPFVRYYDHAFKYIKDNSVKWYINKCISTFGWDPACPICQKNSELYESAFEEDKKIASERRRSVNYVSNVLIINDPINPENNGKVFLWRYGKKIYEKIEKQLFPTDVMLKDEDFVEANPFDLFKGVNFKLKIKMQGEYPNYDDSDFSKKPGPAGGSEEAIDEAMEATYNLSEFVDVSKYPTVEETLSQVGHLLGVSEFEEKSTSDDDTEEDIFAEDTEDIEDETSTEDTLAEEDDSDIDVSEDEDDDEEFFKQL